MKAILMLQGLFSWGSTQQVCGRVVGVSVTTDVSFDFSSFQFKSHSNLPGNRAATVCYTQRRHPSMRRLGAGEHSGLLCLAGADHSAAVIAEEQARHSHEQASREVGKGAAVATEVEGGGEVGERGRQAPLARADYSAAVVAAEQAKREHRRASMNEAWERVGEGVGPQQKDLAAALPDTLYSSDE